MKRALITGINGFVGSHLAEFLINNNLAQVFGTIKDSASSTENISEVKDKIKLIECDITDAAAVESAVKKSSPEIIFHLAAQASIPDSLKDPVGTFSTNVAGTLNIFEAVRKSNINPVIHLASSGAAYGLAFEKEMPLRETNPLRPLNPYAVSKAAMDLFAFQYFKTYGLKTIVTRAFNHAGPRQNDQFVISNWSKQIAMIEKGLQAPVVSSGDLRNARDFTDVRDIVRAYWLVSNKGKPGEIYNVCSGKTVSLKQLFSIFARLAKKKVSVKVDSSKVRKEEASAVRASYAKIRSVTEWKPEIGLQKTIADTLDYWRERA